MSDDHKTTRLKVGKIYYDPVRDQLGVLELTKYKFMRRRPWQLCFRSSALPQYFNPDFRDILKCMVEIGTL